MGDPIAILRESKAHSTGEPGYEADEDMILRLANALESALEGLYKVYVNLGEDTDGARNAEQLFEPWVAFDPAKHIPDLVMEHRKEWENAYEEGYADGQRYAHG